MEVGALSIALQAIGGDAVTSALGKVRTELQKTGKDGAAFDNAMASLKGTLVNFASGITVGAVLTKIVSESSNAQFAAAQLEATLKSTKMVAGQSADALNAHAEALARMSIYDDDAISGAQSLLLTFTKIRGATFSEATQAVLNVATAMGTDLKSAAIQVGKALNDPILGVAALARSGIQFTDAQKDMIKQLVEANKLLDAQKVILDELETQFGGSAKAASETLGGALKQLANDFGNLFEISRERSGGLIGAINALSLAFRGLNDVLADIGSGNWRDAFQLLAQAATPGQSAITTLMMRGAAPQTFNQATQTSLFANASAFRPVQPERGATGGAVAGAAKKMLSPFEEYFRQQGLRPLAPTPKAGLNIFGVDPSMIRAQAGDIGKHFNTALAEQAAGVRKMFAETFGAALGQGIAAAFEVGLATKSIGQAFKALTGTILSSFGSMLVQFGTNALIASKAIQKMFSQLFTPGPQSILAASAIIAIGASLMAAGRGITSGVQGGGGGGGYTAGGGLGGGGPITLPGLTFGPTAATTGATMAPRSNIAVTVIGPNDPSAQRQIQELIRNADRRGGTTTV